MTKFSHLDDKGDVKMVDVTDKLLTTRIAKAIGAIYMKPQTIENIKDESISFAEKLLSSNKKIVSPCDLKKHLK